MTRCQPYHSLSRSRLQVALKGYDDWQVEDDFPSDIPVGEEEIDILARLCRDSIEAILRANNPDASATCSPVSARLNRQAGGKRSLHS